MIKKRSCNGNTLLFATGKLGREVVHARTEADEFEGADALVVCTDWDEFKSPNWEKLASVLKGKVIFDESGHGRLHFMARNLAIASRGSGNIHVKIGPAAILDNAPIVGVRLRQPQGRDWAFSPESAIGSPMRP